MSNYPLSNYKLIYPNDDTNFPVNISDTNFAFGDLGMYMSGTKRSGSKWSSLSVDYLYRSMVIYKDDTGDIIDARQREYTNNLVKLDNTFEFLEFNISGIYQITTLLEFIGGGTFNTGTQTFAFSYSTIKNDGTTNLTINDNNIKGPISFLDGSNNLVSSLKDKPLFINGSASGGGTNSFVSTNYGGNVSVSITTNKTCPFFILPNYSTTTINPNVNTITSIYYIPAGTKLYFNIANTSTSTSNGINATGNFTVELLNYVPYFVKNITNLTVSPLQKYEEYYYYTFVPTNATISGTATIETLMDVSMNCLLVGGGGGGGGSYYNYQYEPDILNLYCGGGGGGGQMLNSVISGMSFTLTVGGGGSGGSGSGGSGTKGGDTTLINNVTTSINLTATGGGGGGSINNTSSGGTGGGGQGAYFASNVNDPTYGDPDTKPPTNGGSGSSVTLTEINTSYNVGGAGGGGIDDTYYANEGKSGSGGTLNIGGELGNISNAGGGNGSGYGTGGGGGGLMYPKVVFGGGKGDSGFAVLYWKELI
jgi:hypothetical protein